MENISPLIYGLTESEVQTRRQQGLENDTAGGPTSLSASWGWCMGHEKGDLITSDPLDLRLTQQ